MFSLKGDKVFLRALEPSDLDFLYQLENDSNVWEISGTTKPYSKQILQLYLENAHRDIYDVKQLRLCICNDAAVTVGLLDLYDFDPKNKRAGVGIIILESENKNKGYATEALDLLCGYSKVALELHQLYCSVLEENRPSIRLFEKLGFVKTGIRKDWVSSNGVFKNEIFYQKVLN